MSADCVKELNLYIDTMAYLLPRIHMYITDPLLWYQDGHVDSVCSDSEDPSWVVNVKRGVISGLQNTMKNLDQNHEGTEVGNS